MNSNLGFFSKQTWVKRFQNSNLVPTTNYCHNQFRYDIVNNRLDDTLHDNHQPFCQNRTSKSRATSICLPQTKGLVNIIHNRHNTIICYKIKIRK